MRHFVHAQADEVTPAELAVDREVEQGEVANFVRVLQINTDGPDVLGFERWCRGGPSVFATGSALCGRIRMDTMQP